VEIHAHHPVIKRIYTVEGDTTFNLVRMSDDGGGELAVFLKADWSDWDALVEAVEIYRAEQAASMNRKEEMLEVVP
jgi:hypothetical protein